MRSNASSVSTSESVARIAASESTLAASVPPMPPVSTTSSVIVALHALRHLRGEAVGGGRHAAGERLADRQQVGLEVVRARVAARARREIVCVSSMISSVPVVARRRAQRVVVAGLRQHDADVGQRRLGEHARDVAVGELALAAPRRR